MTNFSRKTRKLTPIKPFTQGKLDGYCGIYSVVNAIHYIYGPISRIKAESLFYEGLAFLERRRTKGAKTIDGTVGSEVRSLVVSCYSAQYPQLRVKKPFHRRRYVPLDEIWRHMRSFLGQTQGIIILGIEGKHSHWSLVYRITDKSLVLFDSSNRCLLPRRNCTTSENHHSRQHILPPTSLMYIYRECEEVKHD